MNIVEILSSVRPACFCGIAFDSRMYAPQILPCSHTFCLRCLSSESQQETRKCPLCSKKYKSYTSNAALHEISERIAMRCDIYNNISRPCDCCKQRYPVTQMRCCRTCEDGGPRYDTRYSCVIVCASCAIDNHSGHTLPPLVCNSGPARNQPTVTFPPPPPTPPDDNSMHFHSYPKRNVRTFHRSSIFSSGLVQRNLLSEASNDCYAVSNFMHDPVVRKRSSRRLRLSDLLSKLHIGSNKQHSVDATDNTFSWRGDKNSDFMDLSEITFDNLPDVSSLRSATSIENAAAPSRSNFRPK